MDLVISDFRGNFAEFASEAVWPDDTLNQWYEIGKLFIDDNDCTLPEEKREYGLELMLAHLLKIEDMQSNGINAAPVQSASEGQVSVSLAVPSNGDSDFSLWLKLTSYGRQLLVLLSIQAVGGFSVGGSPRYRYRTQR